ncbi:hypothetical protein C0J52_16665 [Blattella germanica]|nr:hypothetical protein C0J52_16665 [Blattella germanica]
MKNILRNIIHNPCQIHFYKKFNETNERFLANDEKLKLKAVTSQNIPPSWELIH